MRTAVALLSLVWIGGAALAQVAPSAPPKPAADAKEGQKAPTAGKKGRKARSETAKEAKASKQDGPPNALTSCLELWEPATHMTRREWARACRRVDERLKAVTLR
jgi:hypothetical protein